MSPARVNFELTTRCNLSCIHCLRDKALRNDLPVRVIKKVLAEIPAYGINRISFTGGEPLIYPEFQSLTEFAVRRGFKIAFVTNGVLLPKFIEFLARPEIKAQIEWLCVSLEGPDPESNDRIRGKGSFEKALKGILAVRARQIPFAIKFTITARNYHQLEEMALLSAKLGAFELQLSQLYPTPENLSLGLMLPPDQWQAVQDEAMRLKDLLKMNVVFSSSIFTKENFPLCSHLAMNEYYVDSRGWLCVCCMLGGIAGRDSRKQEKDRIADLSRTSFVDAHRKLINRINWFNLKRLKRIGEQKVSELEHYQCLACGFHFGKLDWLKDFPDSVWAKMLKQAKGG